MKVCAPTACDLLLHPVSQPRERKGSHESDDAPREAASQVEGIFKKLESGRSAAEPLLRELSDDLAAHMAIEQNIFYPAVRRTSADASVSNNGHRASQQAKRTGATHGKPRRSEHVEGWTGAARRPRLLLAFVFNLLARPFDGVSSFLDVVSCISLYALRGVVTCSADRAKKSRRQQDPEVDELHGLNGYTKRASAFSAFDCARAWPRNARTPRARRNALPGSLRSYLMNVAKPSPEVLSAWATIPATCVAPDSEKCVC
jgi:hypothetical protein